MPKNQQYFYPPELATPLLEGVAIGNLTVRIAADVSDLKPSTPLRQILKIGKDIEGLYNALGNEFSPPTVALITFFREHPIPQMNFESPAPIAELNLARKAYIVSLQTQPELLHTLSAFNPVAMTLLRHEIKIFTPESNCSHIMGMLLDLQRHSEICSKFLPIVKAAVLKFEDMLARMKEADAYRTHFKILSTIEAAEKVLSKFSTYVPQLTKTVKIDDEEYQLSQEVTILNTINTAYKPLATRLELSTRIKSTDEDKTALQAVTDLLKLDRSVLTEADIIKQIMDVAFHATSLLTEYAPDVPEESCDNLWGLQKTIIEWATNLDARYRKPVQKNPQPIMDRGYAEDVCSLSDEELQDHYAIYLQRLGLERKAAIQQTLAEFSDLRHDLHQYLTTGEMRSSNSHFNDFLGHHHSNYHDAKIAKQEEAYALKLCSHYLRIYTTTTDEVVLALTKENMLRDISSYKCNMLYVLFKKAPDVFNAFLQQLPQYLLCEILSSLLPNPKDPVLYDLLNTAEAEEILTSIITNCHFEDLLMLATEEVSDFGITMLEECELTPELATLILEQFEQANSLHMLSRMPYYKIAFMKDPETAVHCAIRAGVIAEFLTIVIDEKSVQWHIARSTSLKELCEIELHPDKYTALFSDTAYVSFSTTDGSNDSPDSSRSTPHQPRKKSSLISWASVDIAAAMQAEGIEIGYDPHADEGYQGSPQTSRRETVVGINTTDTVSAAGNYIEMTDPSYV